jgi:hypothetical protein
MGKYMADKKSHTVHFGPDAVEPRADSSPEEIRERLNEIGAMVSNGATIPEALEKNNITQALYDQWRESGPSKTNRRAQLVREAARLKKVTGFLSDVKSTLDKRISKNARKSNLRTT